MAIKYKELFKKTEFELTSLRYKQQELEWKLTTTENELIELREYKKSAEAQLKEYEQATKLSGQVNAKLMRELLGLQDKLSAIESQKPCATLLEVDEENMSYEYFEIHNHIPVGTNLYMNPISAENPSLLIPIHQAQFANGTWMDIDKSIFENYAVRRIVYSDDPC